MSLSARDRFLQAEKEKEKEKDKDKDKRDKRDKDPKPSSSSSAVSSAATSSVVKPAAASSGNPASKTDDQLVAEALKSGEWKEVSDPKSGKTYFYNPKTKATTWDLKKELRKQVGPPPDASPAAPTPTSVTPSSVAPSQDVVATPVAAERLEPASPVPATPQPVAQVAQPAVASVTPAATSATSGLAAGLGPSGSLLPTGVMYQDPVQRLLEHNEQLQRMTGSQTTRPGGGLGGAAGGLSVAMDFQAKYDAMVRTNQALSAQLERVKSENDAMARGLVDAHKKIHELQMLLQAPQTVLEKTREDELHATMAHLRESNRVLVTHVGELSVLLARGLNESAARLAEMPMRSGPGSDDSSAAAGAQLITRFLDTAARHTLCPNCVLSVTRFRDKLLSPSETNVGRAPRGGPVVTQGIASGNAVPVYDAVPDFTTPPPSHYFNAAQQQPANLAPGVGTAVPRSTSVPGGANAGQPVCLLPRPKRRRCSTAASS